MGLKRNKVIHYERVFLEGDEKKDGKDSSSSWTLGPLTPPSVSVKGTFGNLCLGLLTAFGLLSGLGAIFVFSLLLSRNSFFFFSLTGNSYNSSEIHKFKLTNETKYSQNNDKFSVKSEDVSSSFVPTNASTPNFDESETEVSSTLQTLTSFSVMESNYTLQASTSMNNNSTLKPFTFASSTERDYNVSWMNELWNQYNINSSDETVQKLSLLIGIIMILLALSYILLLLFLKLKARRKMRQMHFNRLLNELNASEKFSLVNHSDDESE